MEVKYVCDECDCMEFYKVNDSEEACCNCDAIYEDEE